MNKHLPLYPVSPHNGCYLKTPIYVLSVFVATLKQYFGTSQRMAIEQSKYLWKQDQGESDLWISEEFNANRDVVGKRPAILVALDQQAYPESSLNDELFFDKATSTLHQYQLIQTGVRFRCLSESMLASMELATEMRYFISVFRNPIAINFGFDKLRGGATTVTQKVDEYKEYWVTDFFCDLKYQENWGVTLENLKVKSIFTSLRIDEDSKKVLAEQPLT